MERPLVSARLVFCFISVITWELVNWALPEMRIIANLSQSFFNPSPDFTTVTDVQAKCGTSVDSSTSKYFLYCVARDSSTSISSFNLFQTYPDSMNETQKSQVLLDELNPQGVPIKPVYINYEPAVQRLVLIFKEHGGVYLTLNG